MLIRKILLTFVSAALLAVPHPAHASHPNNFYCSPSGDICQSTRKIGHRRVLGLMMSARYFKWFHLCVADPKGYEICVPLHVRKHKDGTFGRDVRWLKHFPHGGKGTYRVRWIHGGEHFGRVLEFRVQG